MSKFDSYMEKSKESAEIVGKLVRKREVDLMVKGDMEVAATQREEIVRAMNTLMDEQDEMLANLISDPLEAMSVIRALIGKPKDV